MTSRFYTGPVDFGVFPDKGLVVIGYEGGLFSAKPGAKMEFRDYSGNVVEDLRDTDFGAEATTGGSGHAEVNMEGKRKHFEHDVRYLHINHLHQQMFSSEQVQRGAYFNFGTNERPLIFEPFFTCSAYTGGIGLDSTPPLLDKCLKIARGSYRGNWRSYVVNEDGNSFSISGDE
jgi:hypothetical protein